MKIFLCGGGSGEVAKNAINKFGSIIDKTKPLLYAPLAMDEYRYDNCLEWIKKEMSIINLSDIEMVTSGKELSEKKFENYCAIYIGGGNTYKLLKILKESESFGKLQKYINDDGIIFGGSAGAIIFGEDIDSCKMQDPNNVDLNDTEGFDVLHGYSILCHLNRNDKVKFDRDKNSIYLLEFSKKNKTIYIPDDDTIFVNDNKITLIGNSDYRIYENGCYKVKNALAKDSIFN